MKNYSDSNYARNKSSEGIVYRFANHAQAKQARP